MFYKNIFKKTLKESENNIEKNKEKKAKEEKLTFRLFHCIKVFLVRKSASFPTKKYSYIYIFFGFSREK